MNIGWKHILVLLFFISDDDTEKRNAIKLRNTCQVWTFFVIFLLWISLATKRNERKKRRNIFSLTKGSYSSFIWFIEIESSLMAALSYQLFLLFYSSILKKFTISQLKSSRCSPFKLMKHHVFTLPCWNRTLITFPQLLVPPTSASHSSKILTLRLTTPTWINLIIFFYLLCIRWVECRKKRHGTASFISSTISWNTFSEW